MTQSPWSKAVRLPCLIWLVIDRHGTAGTKQLPKTPLLAPKLTALTASLTSALLHTLSDPMQRKTAVVHLTALLQRLHAGPAARAAFLAMRAELMRKRVRALRYAGSSL